MFRRREARLTGRLLRAVPPVLALAVLVVIGLAGRRANPGPTGFPLDDAWIHMVYGRGLLADGVLSYVDGVPTTGATSPFWAILLAAAHAVAGARGPGHVVATVQGLGVLLHLAAVVVAGDLARRLSGSEWVGAVGGGLLALATPFAAASFSGMEVTLAGLLLLLAVRSAAAGSWGGAGVWLALAGGTRPEAGVAVLVLGVSALLQPRGPSPRKALGRLLAAPVVAGLLFVAYDLWASGAPLPSAFYAKSSFSLDALPGRVGRAFRGVLPQVPPLGTPAGWLALAGLLPGLARTRPRPGGHGGVATGPEAREPLGLLALPAVVAVFFLLANVALIDPVDPAAFYHVRYLLPAVPLLLVALALGGHRLGTRLSGRWGLVPLVVLGILSAAGAARTVVPVSVHLHNDVRNINEVQRRIGEWLAAALPEGTWIATSDAGAVRYFSRLPAVDVTGLNTPAMRHPSDEFLRAHAVAAVVLLPAWYASPDAELLESIFHASTEGYTVTSNPRMALQVVLRLRETRRAQRRRVRFVGLRDFSLDLVPWPADAPVS